MSQWRVSAFHLPPAASHDALSLNEGDALGSVEWRAQPANTASINSTGTIVFIVTSCIGRSNIQLVL